MKLRVLAIMIVLATSFLPSAIVQGAIVSSTISTSTTKNSEPLLPYAGNAISLSKPIAVSQAHTDIGLNKLLVSANRISLGRDSGNMTISPALEITASGLGITNLVSPTTLKNSTVLDLHYATTFGITPFSQDIFIKNSTRPYDREMIIQGSNSPILGTIIESFQLSNLVKLPNVSKQSICDMSPHTDHRGIVFPPCTVQFYGTIGFDWHVGVGPNLSTFNNATQVVTFAFPSTFILDPLLLDNSGTGSCGAASTCTVTLSTVSANDLIIVSCGCYTSVTTFTIADAASLSWTLRASTGNYGGNTKQLEWFAVAASPLSSDVITITGCGGCYYGIVANGISGANTVTPFDANADVPMTDNNDPGCPTSGGGNFYPCVTGFSTSNADDFLELMCSDTGNNNVSGGTGMILIGQNFGQPQNAYAEYKIVSAIQVSVILSFGGVYISQAYGCIADAIVQATATTTTSSSTTTTTTSTSTIRTCQVTYNDHSLIIPFYAYGDIGNGANSSLRFSTSLDGGCHDEATYNGKWANFTAFSLTSPTAPFQTFGVGVQHSSTVLNLITNDAIEFIESFSGGGHPNLHFVYAFIPASVLITEGSIITSIPKSTYITSPAAFVSCSTPCVYQDATNNTVIVKLPSFSPETVDICFVICPGSPSQLIGAFIGFLIIGAIIVGFLFIALLAARRKRR